MQNAGIIPKHQHQRLEALLHDYAKFGVTGSIEIQFQDGHIVNALSTRKEL